MAVTNADFANNVLSLVDDIVSADLVEISNAIYEKQFEIGGVAEQHEVITGVRQGSTVPILLNTPNPDSFPFVDDTSCVATECDVDVPMSAFQWDLGLIECRVPICMRSFDENFLRFFNTWKQTQAGEPNMDNALLDYLMMKFEENLRLSTWRATYFGDTGSGSAYYSGIDGFFVQLEAGAGDKIVIAENNESTFTDQIGTLTGAEVFDYLTQMYNLAATKPWFDPSMLEFRITRTLATKLIAYFTQLGTEKLGDCGCIDPNNASKAVAFNFDNLRLYGIPIRVHGEWDQIINYSTVLNGGGGDNARTDPHRAVLTYRENLLIGTNSTETLESFDIFYDKTDRKIYMDGGAYVGAAVPLGDYVYAGGTIGT